MTGLVAFAATASLAAAALAVTAGASVPGNPTAGKTLFVRSGLFCSSCHTLKAAGSKGRSGPNLDQTKLAYATIVEIVTKGGKPSKQWPTGMPAYAGPHAELDKARIEDIAAFIYNATHK